MARFAYLWKDMSLGAPAQRHTQPRLLAVPVNRSGSRELTTRHNVDIREEADGLHIDLSNFTIIIKSR